MAGSAPRRGRLPSLIRARDTLDLGSPLLEQLACCWLLENEQTLLPPRRAMLAARRDMCAALMAEYFSPLALFASPRAGYRFWVELPKMLATQFSVRAENAGIHIGTGTRFGLEGAFDRYLRLPFTLPDTELRNAFSIFTTAVADPYATERNGENT